HGRFVEPFGGELGFARQERISQVFAQLPSQLALGRRQVLESVILLQRRCHAHSLPPVPLHRSTTWRGRSFLWPALQRSGGGDTPNRFPVKPTCPGPGR